jgi:hypothetical protein
VSSTCAAYVESDSLLLDGLCVFASEYIFEGVTFFYLDVRVFDVFARYEFFEAALRQMNGVFHRKKYSTMPSVTLTKISFTNANSPIRIRFGKRTYEFTDLDHMKEYVAQTIGVEQLEAIAMALLIARQPNITNPAAVEGRSVNVNLANNTWGTLT